MRNIESQTRDFIQETTKQLKTLNTTDQQIKRANNETAEGIEKRLDEWEEGQEKALEEVQTTITEMTISDSEWKDSLNGTIQGEFLTMNQSLEELVTGVEQYGVDISNLESEKDALQNQVKLLWQILQKKPFSTKHWAEFQLN